MVSNRRVGKLRQQQKQKHRNKSKLNDRVRMRYRSGKTCSSAARWLADWLVGCGTV